MSLIRVDFYLLNDSHPTALGRVACRLIDKAYRSGHQVFVCCANQADAIALDEQLWTYKPESFIPHALAWETLIATPPIRIGLNCPPESTHDLLFNLAPTCPDVSATVTRIMEIVATDEDSKILSRDRYRAYRKLGYELHTHHIN